MDIEFVDNAESSRFELRAGDEVVGFLDYRLRDDHIPMVHTEVDPALRGRGVGEAVVRHALEAARSGGVQVIPTCPFVKKFIERHPEYRDVVA